MTQSRDGISLAHARALKLMGVARRLSLAAAVFLIAAFVAGTAGTSYADKHKDRLNDTVVVSNYGAAFAGSVETFVAGSAVNAKPFKSVNGVDTLLDFSDGPGGDAQSSFTGEIAVTLPLNLLDIIPVPNGWVQLISAGANGNSEPDYVIASPYTGYPYYALDYTGLDLPQGVAYRNPYYCAVPGVSVPADEATGDPADPLNETIAVSNYPVVVVDPPDYNPVDDVYYGLCTPNAPGYSVGTITEYHTNSTVHTGPGSGDVYDCSIALPGLTPFSPPFDGINVICPHHNNPVIALGTSGPYYQNATIGGCATYLLGPMGVAFSKYGELMVVNEIGGYVTVYAPWAQGNALPAAIFGGGYLKDPQYVAVDQNDLVYVTDAGDNSIKVFGPPSGDFVGEIVGGKTKLKRPEGIAYAWWDDSLYVVNNHGNSLNEYAEIGDNCPFSDVTPPICNLPASFILSGKIGGRAPAMNFPVGAAVPAFSPDECDDEATTSKFGPLVAPPKLAK